MNEHRPSAAPPSSLETASPPAGLHVAPRAPSSRSKRILLADDDPGVRGSLTRVLQSEGFLVLPAPNGEEAIQLASASKVDLVLLDLNMPVRNGWDVFEHLTTENPLLPVVIITARQNQLFTALGAGAGALLEKPLDIPVLLQTISALLAESSETRLARLAGRSAAFFYRPTDDLGSRPTWGHWGINE